MAIRIVTDSTCDLPEHLVKQHNITVVPLYINAGGREYRDGVDLTKEAFYEQLPHFKPMATTAAPSPDVFRNVYDQLADEGADEILSIHISFKLSATVTIVQQAAAETTRVKVTVLDARSLSLGTGFLALTAAQAAAAGHSMEAILAILEDQIKRTHVFAALDTLEYLRRSGRMNFALSFLGTLLQIKPFLKMYDGDPVAERIRTRSGAMRRLIELIKAGAPYEKVAMLHSNARERAEALLAEVKALLPDGETIIETITPTLGAHLGPGVIGFACISKRPLEV